MSNTTAPATIIATDAVPFDCSTCYDTGTVDHDGAEHACSACPERTTLKVTKLRNAWYLASTLATAVEATGSTIVLVGTRSTLLADVANARRIAVARATAQGLKGRNYESSAEIAFERRVRSLLA